MAQRRTNKGVINERVWMDLLENFKGSQIYEGLYGDLTKKHQIETTLLGVNLLTVYIKNSRNPYCTKILQELKRIGLRPQCDILKFVLEHKSPEDFKKLFPLLEVFVDRAEPLIYFYLKRSLWQDFEVNLQSINELIKLGFDVND